MLFLIKPSITWINKKSGIKFTNLGKLENSKLKITNVDIIPIIHIEKIATGA